MANVESRSLDHRRGENGVRLDWRRSLPVLASQDVVLREVQLCDAPELAALMGMPEVARFISPPPTTVEGFERFIEHSLRQRAQGEGACFALTLRDGMTPIGILQIRMPVPPERDIALLNGGSATAEWGFALSSSYWGTGLFQQAAELVMEFAFEQLGVHRLEARCALNNGRGQRALSKIGASAEGILRQALMAAEGPVDQVLWTIVDRDWRSERVPVRRVGAPLVH